MSGVYIKGIERQTYASLKIILHPNGQLFVDHGTWYSEHKAVFVPDHGRLIDATAKVQTQLYDDGHEEWTGVEMTVDEYLGYCHNEVPTIIPADKEKQT